MMHKSASRMVWDAIGIPFRLALLPQDWLPSFGWTTLEEERLAAVRPHVRGRLLDVGAGTNTLVREYGNGVGVDVHEWGGGAVVVEDSARLPFETATFDTVTFVACLNHIPSRAAAVAEARRVLSGRGVLIVTMIDPVLGGIGHAIWWYAEDRQRGGMKPGEVGGMWPRDVIAICRRAGFRLVRHDRFVYGMNHLFVFEAS